MDEVEHRDERKSTDVFSYNIRTGEVQTMGQFAKRAEIVKWTPLPCEPLITRAYYSFRRAIAYFTPESVHHARRESRLNSLCGMNG